MKSLELLPIDENILDTLYQDAFGRNTEIASFLNILTNIEGHFVISIDGKWGTGKNFLVKQCEMILDTINDSSKLISENKEKILHLSFLNGSPLTKKLKNQNCIYFDAWANDGYENPIWAILNTLVNKASFIDRLSAIDKKDLIDAVVEMGKNYFSNKLGTSIDRL
ncbi:MAG: KAP family NTPase [Lactobacillus amylovorus]|nr:KAP family NTPase [Lactobacillus amylovorus]